MTTAMSPNTVVRGPVFPEPVQVIVATVRGAGMQIIGRGLSTNQVYDRILTSEQIAKLESSPETEPFDGSPRKFRLGIEALRLGIAYEYDPYFSISIARVDPLPHQLEAVYEYFMKLPRIRFLLADDPGAGKTIMAGLLIKELKIRGLIKRILIITPRRAAAIRRLSMQRLFPFHSSACRPLAGGESRRDSALKPTATKKEFPWGNHHGKKPNPKGFCYRERPASQDYGGLLWVSLPTHTHKSLINSPTTVPSPSGPGRLQKQNAPQIGGVRLKSKECLMQGSLVITALLGLTAPLTPCKFARINSLFHFGFQDTNRTEAN
jgi:hypothetical protein